MKKILLKNGGVALVDDADFKMLFEYRWYFNLGYARGYKKTDKKRKLIYMHRLLLNPKKALVVDHIDRNKLNNQRNNLRICTRVGNLMNSLKRKNNTSGFKGVHMNKKGGKSVWRARLKKDRKEIFIGYFENKKDAALAYNIKVKELFGEVAYQNQL
jgi:hypothetical protein